MSTQRVIATFWNRRWLILTTTLAVVAGSLWWARGLPYLYSSSVVLAANSTDGSAIPAEQAASLRREVWRQLWSESVIYPVIQSDLFDDRRASGETNDMLIERIKRSTGLIEERQGSSAAFRLSYYDLAPEKAQAIANKLGQALDSSSARRASENNIAFRLVQSAARIEGPIKPRLSIVTFFAFGGGLLFGLVLAVISELVSSRRHEKLDSPSVPAH